MVVVSHECPIIVWSRLGVYVWGCGSKPATWETSKWSGNRRSLPKYVQIWYHSFWMLWTDPCVKLMFPSLTGLSHVHSASTNSRHFSPMSFSSRKCVAEQTSGAVWSQELINYHNSLFDLWYLTLLLIEYWQWMANYLLHRDAEKQTKQADRQTNIQKTCQHFSRQKISHQKIIGVGHPAWVPNGSEIGQASFMTRLANSRLGNIPCLWKNLEFVPWLCGCLYIYIYIFKYHLPMNLQTHIKRNDIHNISKKNSGPDRWCFLDRPEILTG